MVRKMILVKKDKYTMKDVNDVIVESLFFQGGTYSEKQALAVVINSAQYHKTTVSKNVIYTIAKYLKE